MELAGSTLGLAGIGYLVDRYRGQADSYGVAVGALIGFAFGMYRLIKLAMREAHQHR
jgi:F0F1-type ATP synthase assembly protein I